MTALQLRPTIDTAETELAAHAARLATMEPWSRLGYRAEGLLALLSSHQPDRQSFLIQRGGRPAGVLVLRDPWWRGIYIELFAVYPEAQQQGVGRAALDLIEARRRPGRDNLWLLVSGFNSAAQTFYRRQGFELVGQLPDLLASGEDEILMRKRLQPPYNFAISDDVR